MKRGGAGQVGPREKRAKFLSIDSGQRVQAAGREKYSFSGPLSLSPVVAKMKFFYFQILLSGCTLVFCLQLFGNPLLSFHHRPLWVETSRNNFRGPIIWVSWAVYKGGVKVWWLSPLCKCCRRLHDDDNHDQSIPDWTGSPLLLDPFGPGRWDGHTKQSRAAAAAPIPINWQPGDGQSGI